MSSMILVGTDGSDLAIGAAVRGLESLRAADQVVVATVIAALDSSLAYDGSGHAGPSMTQAELDAQRSRAWEDGQDALERTVAALEAAHRSVRFEPRVVEGDPGPARCRLADELAPETLVIATRGRGGLKRAVLGSVSDHVVRNASCPVLVVNPSAGSDAGTSA